MSVDLPVDRLELDALREKVAIISDENKYLNDQNDALVETNGHLAIDNEDLKKKLSLAEERAERYFDFWRSAEEELTKQLELNEKLKQQLEAAKAGEPEAKESSN
ncbi:hypothetical protein FVEG_13541 [Fusarium verticillioides 7600]|uniref:Uncharacterized protein n=2 Tax=Fusarium TaxID=5506 RepID=W7N764_GIBM7|nr:hypothetical protein FVEG_13541 [Fusarium verticillioides 7600]XP_044677302.1 hypothetical protein J7337_011199 [Fusarium musae]RBQ78854.1 hypothetical protein FVER14953_13541 [Fusarium verticillioides]EWG55554.1 hypothetical protein FVEG_13541 [Fusarium verticillioides 7600]KAG9498302.1 hypothetical protein J7337_011199 [Fusarium musae]RBQ87932.1 hypothetical protein FVER53263_13541 [Fusarium verticillioides]RBR13741.1 hypothetical protein FVER53590_13541 [Fusarium verticillioides]